MSDFASFGLSAPILAALTRAEYTIPTPIQAQAIPHVMRGADLLGIAQTGTGKTAAFALPIIHRLMAERRPYQFATACALPGAGADARTGQPDRRKLQAPMAARPAMRVAVIFGGVPKGKPDPGRGPGVVDVIVATPGPPAGSVQRAPCPPGPGPKSWCWTKPTTCWIWAS